MLQQQFQLSWVSAEFFRLFSLGIYPRIWAIGIYVNCERPDLVFLSTGLNYNKSVCMSVFFFVLYRIFLVLELPMRRGTVFIHS